MYTLVMMAALTTAPETTQANGFFRDLAGGSGCHSDSNSQSDGAKCHGGNCTGCSGGVFHGRIISFFSFGGGSCHSNCNGKSASAGSTCHGSSCNGSTCHGSSCNGSRRDLGFSSCNGSGYQSSCFGSSCTGNSFPPMTVPSFPGGDFAQPNPVNYGAGYGGGCFGSGMPSAPGGFDPAPYSNPYSVPSEQSTYRPTVIDDSQRGVIVVRLPEDAKLYAEGRPLALKTDVRRFVTPAIPADRDAVYNLRVEYIRDGEVISRTKRVTIRAGDTKTLEFVEQSVQIPSVPAPELYAGKPALGTPMAPALPTLPTIPSLPSTNWPSGTPTVNKPQPLPPLGGGSVTVIPPPQVSSDRAKITVKLPTGATLFVDSKKNPRTDAVREFTTPALKKGELYTYQLRIEFSRNGQPESEERKVEFMAGELHTVDFTMPVYRASR